MRNKEKFIQKCNEKFGNKFDYSKLDDSKKVDEKHIVICPIHGEFETTLKAHYRSMYGCAKCAKEAGKKNFLVDKQNLSVDTSSFNIDTINELTSMIIENPIITDSEHCIGSIYVFINRNTNKIYIGKTISSYNERFNEHRYNAFTKKTKNYFYDSLRKHGWEAFDKIIVYQTEVKPIKEKVELDKEICQKEIEYIKQFNSNNSKYGYNITSGGEGVVGYKFSEETRKKMSESRKGEKHHNFGKFGKDNPTSIPVYQFDLDFNFIREWDSIADIGRELGYKENNIGRCCSNKLMTYKGFIWVRKSDYYDGYLQEHKSRAKCISNDKAVLQYDLEGNFIKEYISASEASRWIGCDSSLIAGCAKGKWNTGKGYTWFYKELFTEDLLKERLQAIKSMKKRSN